ncbi:ESX secretion-associated protein EspG [Nocardia jinanensis]|uniref:ESX secretion-associated protein EspG n=2 Tax=Nocardia jinanensis TaxID=382504 RepID=A0A917RB61_9NOCA|nr:ESX secretion-associated protein EspG [Nocardia jinanensis]GGK98605.1 hypothetical protein GCM10011588_11480 [Nocardia jinanensis]
MMRRRWELTGREFMVLWKDLREVLLPAPFTYISDTRYLADGERRNHETREHLRTVDKYGLEDTLDIVARPDLRIILHAWDPRAPDDASTHVRLHAVRRSARTYLLQQQPGETVQHSGGFTIIECDYLSVADLMVSYLPERPAGRLTDLVFSSSPDSLDRPGTSPVRQPHEDADSVSAQEFIGAPQVLAGAVEIRQGIAPLGPKYRAQRGFWVHDLADDGRYVVMPGRPRRATGIDSSGLANRINAAVAEVIVAIKDQRSRV